MQKSEKDPRILKRQVIVSYCFIRVHNSPIYNYIYINIFHHVYWCSIDIHLMSDLILENLSPWQAKAKCTKGVVAGSCCHKAQHITTQHTTCNATNAKQGATKEERSDLQGICLHSLRFRTAVCLSKLDCSIASKRQRKMTGTYENSHGSIRALPLHQVRIHRWWH